MKILLFSKYSRLGASTRLRSLQYLPYLEAQGIDVTVSSLFDDQYLSDLYQRERRSPARIAKLYWQRLTVLFNVRQYDLIWIEKEIFPYLPAFAERFLSALAIPYIVDYDDAVFHNYDLSANPVIRWLLGQKIDVVMQKSACVVAGNNYLAARAISAGAQKVVKLPTVVDRLRYRPAMRTVAAFPVIGWIGSPSTQCYVVEIAQALSLLCQEFKARLLLVGASPGIAELLPGCNVEVVPWSEETEAHLIAQMDIGIMPLPDGSWEKGKCGYKLIQYMACAVPVVASPVGVNVEIVNDSQCGLLADKLDEWQSALTALLKSPEMRKRYGAAGYSAVEKIYSLQAQSPVLTGLFREIFEVNESLKCAD